MITKQKGCNDIYGYEAKIWQYIDMVVNSVMEKYNYKYDYLGGTITIKSLPAEIVVTSYVKEYGEKYYTNYGLGTDYQSFAKRSGICVFACTKSALFGLVQR